jgi:NAD(P)-dependent dehydrogenase (short-subunit alcohol dehydrogenase family)
LIRIITYNPATAVIRRVTKPGGDIMESISGKIAVVTGGGTGMGRELCLLLAARGAHVALCDISEENMSVTAELCRAAAPAGTTISTHICDVSDEAQVVAFRDAVTAAHQTEHISLLFNNAGIGGGGSFVNDDREKWELTFNICWGGVYYCARAFMPLLIAAEEAIIVNTSSINGFWGSVGPHQAHTSYSAAKFAVKGFTESLMTDLRINAPHVKAAVVMPGHIGTSIGINSGLAHGPVDTTVVRKRLAEMGLPVDQWSNDEIAQMIADRAIAFRDNAPTTATEAAAFIVDQALAGEWRILVGDDAVAIDEFVRADPGNAYEPEFLDRVHAAGHLQVFG